MFLVLFIKLVNLYAFLQQGKPTDVKESNVSQSTNERMDPSSSGKETKNEKQET
jgi:hypothetical protein